MRRYKYGQHGVGDKSVPGHYVFKKGKNIEVWRPSWNKTTTTIRIFPAVSPDDPSKFDPWRFSDQQLDWGDWVRTYPAVRGLGNPSVTFILYDPAEVNYDVRHNPAVLLNNAIRNAVRSGQGNPKWASLLLPSENRREALRGPENVTFVQCAIFAHNNIEYDPPRGGAINDRTVIMELSSSATKAMFEQMNEKNPEYTGPRDNFNEMFINGDPVSPEHGRFVHFYQLGHDPREKGATSTRHPAFGAARSAHGRSSGSNEPIGYGCFMTEKYNGFSACMKGHEDLIRTMWKPWDSIIHIPDHAEQIAILSGCFPPDAIVYALQDHYPELIPESVWRSVRNRVSVGYSGRPKSQPSAAPTEDEGGAVEHLVEDDDSIVAPDAFPPADSKALWGSRRVDSETSSGDTVEDSTEARDEFEQPRLVSEPADEEAVRKAVREAIERSRQRTAHKRVQSK